ncbi:MAG TPA: transposase [Steroidobacteraceae bacterium]|nr:transposase [Steroidobacteraceae bacterium]
MERLQAYKFELRPDGAQRRLMRQFAGSCRYVYNRALALQKTRYGRGEKKLGYAGLCKELTAWRNEAMWLAAAHSQILQQALKDLEHAYRNFFEKRAAFPRFKKKGQRDSFRFPQGTQLEQSHDRIYLPKLGWMRYRNSRAVPGEVRNATVSLSAGRWFVSIQTRQQDAPTVNPARTAIGIDMGVARFAMLSDGAVYEPLDSFKRHQRRLAHYQRMMSRRSKFGKNWQNARRKVQKVHARIGNCRRDYLHKATTTISKNHAMVCIEDLQVRNMSKSAAGSVESPGRNVRAKSWLNRSILDQGWFEFRRQLQYKLAWSGGMLIVVPPHNTSRECPACGHTEAANRMTQAQFRCVECGFSAHADLVGAINVLARGHRVAACGDTSPARGASAQEPAEANLYETVHAAP